MNVLSYWKPIHKAVQYHCNLCGVSCGDNEYQTAQARRMEAAEREGHYLFCNSCSPHVEKLVGQVAAEEQRLTREAQANVEERLAAFANDLLCDLRGAASTPPSATSVSPPEPALKKRPPATRITPR